MKPVWTIVTCVIGVMLVSLAGLPAFGEEGDLAAIAKVNNTVITRKNLQWATRHAGGFDSLPAYQLQEKMVDELINREVLFQESTAQNITVSDAEQKRHLSRLLKSLKISQNEFMENIGLSEAEIYAEITKDIAIQKLLDLEIHLATEVSTREARAYYDNHPDKFIIEGPVHAYHILIKVSPTADDAVKTAAREKINAILEQLRYGADFSESAKKYSECPSRIKGGDLGFVTRGQKYKKFENAVFSLVEGEISGVVETPLGYHLITVTEKQPSSVMAFDKVEKQLKQFLIKEKNAQLINDLVQDLRQKSNITLFTN